LVLNFRHFCVEDSPCQRPFGFDSFLKQVSDNEKGKR
jgi:hypothetical protein